MISSGLKEGAGVGENVCLFGRKNYSRGVGLRELFFFAGRCGGWLVLVYTLVQYG